jgi:hypothetical protein
VDALALFVNKDNPTKGLTVAEADALFSKSRRHGHAVDLTKWGQLGLTGDWAGAPVSLYGRNSASGTYGFFKEHALKNGDFKDQVKEQPGSASVVQGISEDRYGIGYSGIGYSTSGVKMLPLAAKARPTVRRTHPGEHEERHVPALAILVHLRESGSGETPLAHRERVSHLRLQQRGAIRRAQGRVFPRGCRHG